MIDFVEYLDKSNEIKNKHFIMKCKNIDIHRGLWPGSPDYVYIDIDVIKHICENIIDIHDRPCECGKYYYCKNINHNNIICNICEHNKTKCLNENSLYNIMEKIIISAFNYRQNTNLIDVVLDNGFYPSSNNIKNIRNRLGISHMYSYVQSYLPFIDNILKYNINNILTFPKNIITYKHIPKILFLIIKYGKSMILPNIIKFIIMPYVFTYPLL